MAAHNSAVGGNGLININPPGTFTMVCRIGTAT
jgi:hypothetical protein